MCTHGKIPTGLYQKDAPREEEDKHGDHSGLAIAGSLESCLRPKSRRKHNSIVYFRAAPPKIDEKDDDDIYIYIIY